MAAILSSTWKQSETSEGHPKWKTLLREAWVWGMTLIPLHHGPGLPAMRMDFLPPRRRTPTGWLCAQDQMRLAKTTDSRTKLPEFESHLHHLLDKLLICVINLFPHLYFGDEMKLIHVKHFEQCPHIEAQSSRYIINVGIGGQWQGLEMKTEWYWAYLI